MDIQVKVGSKIKITEDYNKWYEQTNKRKSVFMVGEVLTINEITATKANAVPSDNPEWQFTLIVETDDWGYHFDLEVVERFGMLLN